MVKRASAGADSQVHANPYPRIATRAVGTSTLYFGNIPIAVRIYPAAQASYQSFRWISPQGNAVKLQYHDAQTGKPLRHQDLRRAVEVSKDKLLSLSQEEWEHVNGSKKNLIELREAIPQRELSPFSIERHYFLVPAKKSHKAYRLLQGLLKHSKRALLGKWYLPSGRDKFIMVTSSGLVLLMSHLYYQSELREPPLSFEDASIPGEQEARLGADLLDRMTPAKVSLLAYQDEWGSRLDALVERKPNLVTMLKASLKKKRQPDGKRRRRAQD